jgi:type IV pilus assembly protein PilB
MERNKEKLNRLGEMLLNAKMISAQQLKKALEYQQNTGGRLGEIIEKLGFIKEETLVEFIAQQQELKIVDPQAVVWPEGLIKKIPQSLIEKYTFLPMTKHEDILTIAISDPTDYEAIEEIQLFTNMRVEVVLAHRSALKKIITTMFDKPKPGSTTKEELIKDLESTGPIPAIKEGENHGLVLEALVKLLVSKQVISADELAKKIEESNPKK